VWSLLTNDRWSSHSVISTGRRGIRRHGRKRRLKWGVFNMLRMSIRGRARRCDCVGKGVVIGLELGRLVWYDMSPNSSIAYHHIIINDEESFNNIKQKLRVCVLPHPSPASKPHTKASIHFLTPSTHYSRPKPPCPQTHSQNTTFSNA